MTTPLNIVYAGTPEFAATALAALLQTEHRISAVYTQPDRPAGRGRKLKASPVKELALAHGIEVRQPETLKEAATQQALAALNPDVMIVAAYGLLLPPEVLAIPRLGCLNIHASLLPRWRGAAPIQRAILEGDSETGVTIMQMDVGLDTGDMLYKLATPITAGDNAQTLHDRLATLGAQAIVEAVAALQAGSLTPRPQDESQANYAKKLNKGEAEIDWRLPAPRLARQVAAFNPWPVAQSLLGEAVLRIWEAEALPGTRTGTTRPGQIIAASKQGIDVACGEGTLRLKRLQLPGGKPLTAAEFLNGRTLDGATLGG
jgi:methionyl-tRNA formyltransferase